MAQSSDPSTYLLTCDEGPALEELEQLLSKTKGEARSSLASVAEVARRRKPFSGDIKNSVIRVVSAHLTPQQVKKIKGSRLCNVEKDALAVTCSPGMTNVKALKHVSGAMQEYPVPWGLKQIDADLAWEQSTGEGVKIGVLDTGIDSKHPDLKGRVKRGVSFVDNVLITDDDNGHGTHCSGIIAAKKSNEEGIFGVAPDALVFPIKILNYKGVGTTSAILSGLEWCINEGIQIISMSFRIPGVEKRSVALEQACQVAWEQGIILVAATGNDQEENPQWSVGWPARFETVLGVGAVDKVGTIASFSSTGQGVDLVAPGVDILSTYRGSRYRMISGTSQAAPHVAGAAALLKAYRPSLTNEDVYKVLRETTDPLSVPEPDDTYGSGVLNASWAIGQLDTVLS